MQMQDDALRFLICDREFHATIYRASGNALLSDLALERYGYLADRRRGFIAGAGQFAASIADHRDFLAGLTARDPAAAARAFAAPEERIYATSRAVLAARRQWRGEKDLNETVTGAGGG